MLLMKRSNRPYDSCGRYCGVMWPAARMVLRAGKEGEQGAERESREIEHSRKVELAAGRARHRVRRGVASNPVRGGKVRGL